ncbi:MAG: CHAT domain-containing protein [Nostocaceae cyanobacterium]|nr:CHAT domain-containing protein [Nostocaceae cyanobacterium]
MQVITIREQNQTETGFTAIVSFDGRQEYPVTISNPFTAAQEQELEWYFEDWLVFPTLNTVKAETAAMSVKIYGETLFEQVFKANFDAYSEYRQGRGNLSNVQFEIISNNPEFHALHWEAMRDPDLPRPLAVDAVMLRKSIKPVAVSAYVQPSPVINLLVVTARPDEQKDVSYRTISRPLLEAIAQSKLRVKVELLRPGTYEALSRHLEAKGAGFYHIVHLDMHGALMNYKQVQNPTKANRYLYRGRYGRGDLQPFDGVKAFVCFEGETQGKVDLVEAGELADLLTGKGIPVCILNACQSAKQVNNPTPNPLPLEGEGAKNNPSSSSFSETSLASRLMTAGMQMVVGMGYSVTVTAAKLMMTQLYQHLFAQKPITEAIRLSRKELFNDKERKAYFNKVINLEDWLLPVVYSNQPVNFNLREFTHQEQEEYLLNRSRKSPCTKPLYGFIGRDLEILKVEKSLLRHNILLLQGMGGTGKTTLLNYLREWWQTTHFVEDAFYFGYDQKAWNLSQILFTIAKQVYGDFELRMFQAMPQPAQREQLIDTLRTNRYAVILDNFESVTGQKLAIKNTLSKPKRQEIQDFLERLVGGQTFIVIGSRSEEEWLQERTFDNNIYYLQGLDTEARSDLADKILERHVPPHRIAEIREDADFQKLMKLLDGYPLAMEVTLANLQKQSPQEILAGLQTGDVNLDSGSGDKTKSIIKCVEYSHSNLSADAQKLLLCLAPFSGFIHRCVLPNYIAELQKLEPFQNYAFDKFDEAIQEAINWGLLSGMNLTPNLTPNPPLLPGEGLGVRLLTIQPVFPYFLKSKLETVDEATRKALH